MAESAFVVPDEPVDGYEVRWFEAWHESVTVIECRAVYYANRAWEDVFPDEGRGARFVDQWLVSGGLDGRVLGWSTMRRRAASGERERPMYASRREALLELVARQEELVAHYERMRARAARDVVSLRAELEGEGEEVARGEDAQG